MFSDWSFRFPRCVFSGVFVYSPPLFLDYKQPFCFPRWEFSDIDSFCFSCGVFCSLTGRSDFLAVCSLTGRFVFPRCVFSDWSPLRSSSHVSCRIYQSRLDLLRKEAEITAGPGFEGRGMSEFFILFFSDYLLRLFIVVFTLALLRMT